MSIVRKRGLKGVQPTRREVGSRLKRDDRALLGMPFRLLIGLVSISLIVPILFGAMSSVDYVQTERAVRAEVSRVLLAAQRYLQAGSGGEVIDVSFRGSTLTHVDYVVFGDSPGGPYSRAVRYELSGGREETVLAKNPSVILVSSGGGELRLLEGAYSLHVECSDGLEISIWPV